MDIHKMETFTEAWVAANTQTPVNPGPTSQQSKHNPSIQELPTLLHSEQLGREQLLRLEGRNSFKCGGLLQPLSVLMPTDPGCGGVKSMPIHCVVEQMSSGGGPDGDVTSKKPTNNKSSPGCSKDNSSVELDTYAILPGTTMFTELVRSALIKIGYTASEAVGAKGSIQIKNWKPLTFDTITDNPNSTLDEILGDLTSVTTLRIRLCRSHSRRSNTSVVPDNMAAFRTWDSTVCHSGNSDNREWTDEAVRCAVVDLLKEMTQSTLAKLSPLSQSCISNIANSKYLAKLGPEKCLDFGRWYQTYRSGQPSDFYHQHRYDSPQVDQNIRLTFHPELELPKMRRWFDSYKSPTEELFQSFVDEINNGSIRKQRPSITVKKLKIWWRNEKVRQRRLASCQDTSPRRRGRPRKDSARSDPDQNNLRVNQFHSEPSDDRSPQFKVKNLTELENCTSMVSIDNTRNTHLVTSPRLHTPSTSDSQLYTRTDQNQPPSATMCTASHMSSP